jgi:hypothetical protein
VIFTTSKPERDEALTAIKEAVTAGAYDWPAGEEFNALTNQLAAHLHATVSNNEFEAIIEAFNDYMGRLDWNQEEIMDYLDETRWHPALEDAAWDKALQVLTETTNTVLLAMGHDILTDTETARLYTTTTTELKAAA